MNCVRRHLSAIKGGRLGAACYPATVATLLTSDVPGDDPIDIASGPTVPDPTTCADALAILARYGVDVPPAARALLESGEGETVKPGDPRLPAPDMRMIATPQMALEAAALAAEQGIPAHILSDRIEGEAKDVGKVMAGLALQVANRAQPFPPPCVLLSGGETTVTVRGEGAGAATSSFCSRLGSRSTAILAFMRWRATPMGWTGKKRSPGLFLGRTAWRVPGLGAFGRTTAWPGMTGTASLRRWTTPSSPARRSPTSTTSAPS